MTIKVLTSSYLAFWQFNDMINVPFSSEAFVAGILALFLDATLQKKDSQSRKDRGMHWWDKFRSFKTDTRSEEFYSLPFNLNKFFPSVWSWNHLMITCMVNPTYINPTNISLKAVEKILQRKWPIFWFLTTSLCSRMNDYILQ